jgi:KaiC/GvpD/RAD55 family RecA-like ATPase
MNHDKVKTGVPGLDVMLNGGLQEARTILVTGQCGTGKTLMGFHFLHQGLRERQQCLLLTFEESKCKLFHDASQIGIDLAAMEKAGKLTVAGGTFGYLRHFKDKADVRTNDLVLEIKELIEQTKAKRVVIDSVNLLTLLFENDGDRRRLLGEIIFTLEEAGCTALLTCETPEDSKRFGWFGFEEFMVDGVLSLRRTFFDWDIERSIAVIKMRGAGHSTGVRALLIGPKGLTVYPDQEPASVRLSHHRME